MLYSQGKIISELFPNTRTFVTMSRTTAQVPEHHHDLGLLTFFPTILRVLIVSILLEKNKGKPKNPLTFLLDQKSFQLRVLNNLALVFLDLESQKH